jgi:enamine deaminase RidA (YjgF/YER057c/UK114 family)
MQAIHLPDSIAAPAGHYVPAMRAGNLVHLSGTLPTGNAAAPVPPDAPFSGQLRQLLANCTAILAAAGSSAGEVLSFTLYVTDLDNWECADRILADYFGAHRPARSVLCVAAIRKGYAAQASLIAQCAGPA